MAKIIGVAGGSGSGKTYIARLLSSILSDCAILPLDCFYKDQSHLPPKERELLNYDDLSVLDMEAFARALSDLKADRKVEIPQYDFVTHTRLKETRSIPSAKYVIAEGILIYAEPKYLDHFDYKLYVDCDGDVRLARRLLRDEKERGREPFGVIRQYLSSVRPMHVRYVEPSSSLCDRIFENNGFDGLAKEDLGEVLEDIAKL